ncbi:MAG: histone deacetylase, partial [Thermoleophilia bacterium]|nr:histone deacetylase [Thermoleophilia bacterium]
AHFPGTGFAEEVGREDGAGYTVNVPLRAGDGDAAVRLAFDSLILPLARAYKPQLILVSAGYDGERGDPLGGLNFSRSAFRWMAGTLRELAEELGAAGPVCFLEGGYVPAMLAASVKATLEGLAGDEGEFSPVPTAQEREDVEATLMALRPYWPGVL